MLRRLSLATATAAIAIPVVKAGSNQTSSLSTTMMKPKDLPIYTEPTSKVEYQAVPHEKGQLESSISVVRKQIWKWSDKCQGAIEKTKQVYNTTEKKTKDVVEFIKTEENLAPRAAIIGLAGLTGVVLARKGGYFRKLLYSSVLMAGTASLCYPYQAVKLAKAEYQWVNSKIGLDEAYQKTRDKVSELKPGSISEKSSEKDAATAKLEAVKSENSTSSPNKIDKSMEDHGQSNPEDKDMYSTRS